MVVVIWVIVAAVGGVLLGYAIGAAWALAELERHRQIASNTTTAVFATTIELTYGHEFLEDLIEEAKKVMDTEKDLIMERAKTMYVIGEMRDKLEAMKEKK